MTRRGFLHRTCASVALMSLSTGAFALAGCDSGGANDASLPEGVTRTGTTLTVDTTFFPQLTAAGGFLWIADADVIVIHGAQGDYRAFSSVCPHEGEEVKQFNGEHLRCPAHDWTFTPEGQPTGRANRPLTAYPLTQSGDQLVITVSG